MKQLRNRILLVFPLLVLFCLPWNGEGKPDSNIKNYPLENGCTLAPPDSVWAAGIGTTWLNIEWTAVIGAVEYQVDVYDVTASSPVGTYVVSANNISLTGLTPGHTYDVSVSASSCNGGPYGETNTLRVSTFIIVVDVVLQNHCPVPYDPGSHYSPGNNIVIRVPNNMSRVIHFEVEEWGNPSRQADFYVKMDPSAVSVTGHVASSTSGKTTFVPINNNSELLLADDPMGASWEFLNVNNISYTLTNMGFEIEPIHDLVVNYQVCDPDQNDGFDGGDRSVTTINGTLDFSVNPNPASETTTIQFPDSDNTDRSLQVFNSQGQLVQGIRVGSQAAIELNLNRFESGVYYLVLVDGGKRSYKKLIVTP